ncbi:hypothetical protein COU76_03895 [Candidatus Peregrinibacteria bacterium CG10_big_fil_rev_8_21_14_0_10_49_10]|nr:MAG: hypothetical protein COU76_03895 [Candidatus Peregrinibacteria bacterium CG10_big_fil_rev_8_21_14_0_10_49_10]
MKLLIMTQKVDNTDPILGFFHQWIMQFAQQCNPGFVTVIGQFVGEHLLLANTKVESLEKEKGRGKFSQICLFWKLQWKLRKEYDVVLVHMTPIWIVLGAPLWLLLRKPMYLWYEARGTRWPLCVALLLVRKVFSASSHGMPLRTHKSVVVGHGIDTDFFSPGTEPRNEKSLITVGRITASKHLDVILRAFRELPKDYTLILAGAPITATDRTLEQDLHTQITTEGFEGRVSIRSANQETVRDLLQKATVFVHASETSLDKAVLEAMATGCLVVSTSEAVQPLLSPACSATAETLGARIQEFCELDAGERKAIASGFREQVKRDHSLQRLVERLLEEMEYSFAR